MRNLFFLLKAIWLEIILPILIILSAVAPIIGCFYLASFAKENRENWYVEIPAAFITTICSVLLVAISVTSVRDRYKELKEEFEWKKDI